jgi:hypothetical protein
MSAVDTVLVLDAATSGAAMSRASVLHRHLHDEPMVVLAYHLAGEMAAPLALMYGRDAGNPTLRVAPEPRNRAIRFDEVINPFAADLCAYVEGLAFDQETMQGRYGDQHRCVDAPQIICPNRGTVDYLGRVMGRALRYLRTDGDYAVPDTTPRSGGHLTWLHQQQRLAGTSVMLAATDLLRRHWATGQSSLEDEDLHVQLAWIDPPEGMTGAAAGDEAEARRVAGDLISAGPVTDPSWDQDALAPAVAEFNEARRGQDDAATVERYGGEVREPVEAAVLPTWEATWRALTLLRTLENGASVRGRWTQDRSDFTRHADRVAQGDAFFSARQTARAAAFVLRQQEERQDKVELDETMDDPLVLAGRAVAGEALIGTVTQVDHDHTIPGKRSPLVRQLVTVAVDGPAEVLPGTVLTLTADRKITLEVRNLERGDSANAVLMVTSGMTRPMPEVGDAIGLVTGARSIPAPKMPAGVPWTHHTGEQVEEPLEVPE